MTTVSDRAPSSTIRARASAGPQSSSRQLSRNLTDNSCKRNELHLESGGLFCDSLQLLSIFGFVEFSSSST